MRFLEPDQQLRPSLKLGHHGGARRVGALVGIGDSLIKMLQKLTVLSLIKILQKLTVLPLLIA
jgi:hypothetical protein